MLNTCENSLHFMSTLGLRTFRKLSLTYMSYVCPRIYVLYISLFLDKQRVLGTPGGWFCLTCPGVSQWRDTFQSEWLGCQDILHGAMGGRGKGPLAWDTDFHSPPHHRWPVGSLAGIFICLWMCEGQREVVQLLRLTNKMLWRDLIFRPTSALWNTPNEVGRAEALTVLRVSFSASVLWLLDLFAF